MEQQSNIFDVLGGREAVKAEVSIPIENIVLACFVILITFIIGAFAIKKIKG